MANVPDVLHRVNAARVASSASMLDDLRPGVTGNSASCPLANSLNDVFPGLTVSGDRMTGIPRQRAGAVASALGGRVLSVNGKAVISLPYTLSQFVREFDRGSFQLQKYVKRVARW